MQGLDVEIVTPIPSVGKMRCKVYNDVRFTFLNPPILDASKEYLLPFSYHGFALSLWKYLVRNRFDVLHSHGMTAYAYLHLQQKRVSTIVQTHGNEVFKIQFRNPLKKIGLKFAFQDPYRYCVRSADMVLCEGEFQRKEIEYLYGVEKEKIFSLPPGIDISTIKAQKGKVSRSDLGISEEEFVIISVNGLRPEKGINYLIDAFSMLKKEKINARLLLVGSGPEEDAIKERIIAHGLKDSVTHMKRVPESLLYSLYYISDLYVSPTFQRDFIMSILEAEACGLPIISTGQDFIVLHGANGLIVPPGSARALFDAMQEMYNLGEKRRKQMGLKSQEIAKIYDWALIAKRAIKLYEHLLSRK
jgi:glycosyltransferase involved in cell wall biosynthesis